MKSNLLSLIIIGGLALSPLAGRCDDGMDASKLPPPATQTGVTFAKDIQPIFEKSCVKCHSGEKPKAKLNLQSAAGVLKGSKEGAVIVAGNSAKSPLVYSVAHVGDPDDYMPPLKNKAGIGPLDTAQVSLIRAWIDQGAK